MILPKTLLTICSVWLLYSCSSNALIVPQELPSVLSLVYSNIPPIKKGTDSRLGFGFRLGEHADFQVLVELGPQKNTRPIGDKESDNSFNKRQISKAEQNALLRQQLRQQLQLLQQQQPTSTERNAANWLENWAQDMNASNAIKTNKSKSKGSIKNNKKQNDNTNLTPTMPLVPAKSLQQLQLLYKMATTTGAPLLEEAAVPIKVTSDLSPIKIEERLKSKKQVTKELMDVRLDDDE